MNTIYAICTKCYRAFGIKGDELTIANANMPQHCLFDKGVYVCQGTQDDLIFWDEYRKSYPLFPLEPVCDGQTKYSPEIYENKKQCLIEEKNDRSKARRNLILNWSARLFFIMAFLILPMGTCFHRYQSVVYRADKGIEWLWRARATNELNTMSESMSRGYDMLSNYSGNPCWFFPKPDTDYELINGNLLQNIKTCKEWAMSISRDNMAYQQAVQNMQETIVELVDHYKLADGWLWRTWWMVLYWLLSVIFWGYWLYRKATE